MGPAPQSAPFPFRPPRLPRPSSPRSSDGRATAEPALRPADFMATSSAETLLRLAEDQRPAVGRFQPQLVVEPVECHVMEPLEVVLLLLHDARRLLAGHLRAAWRR